MRKIVLVCAAGMSTSMLVTKMREAAKQMDYECTIDAYPVAETKKVALDADVVLLGPQVRFQLDKVKEMVSCPVEAIDMSDYGTMNGVNVVKRAKELLGD